MHRISSKLASLVCRNQSTVTWLGCYICCTMVYFLVILQNSLDQNWPALQKKQDFILGCNWPRLKKWSNSRNSEKKHLFIPFIFFRETVYSLKNDLDINVLHSTLLSMLMQTRILWNKHIIQFLRNFIQTLYKSGI